MGDFIWNVLRLPTIWIPNHIYNVYTNTNGMRSDAIYGNLISIHKTQSSIYFDGSYITHRHTHPMKHCTVAVYFVRVEALTATKFMQCYSLDTITNNLGEKWLMHTFDFWCWVICRSFENTFGCNSSTFAFTIKYTPYPVKEVDKWEMPTVCF